MKETEFETNHTIAKQLVTFTEVQSKVISSLGRVERQREDKTLMHNIEAAEKGWCVVPAFRTYKEVNFKCELCGALRSIYVDRVLKWARARIHFPTSQNKNKAVATATYEDVANKDAVK